MKKLLCAAMLFCLFALPCAAEEQEFPLMDACLEKAVAETVPPSKAELNLQAFAAGFDAVREL